LNETQNTVSGLARRGGRLALQYNDFTLNAFVVKSEIVGGFKGGTGLAATTDKHILGASAGLKLLDKRVEFRTIFVTGEEDGSSFSLSTTSGTKKGDAVGLLLVTDFFQNRLRTEFETDFSRFDPDTSDEFGGKKDKAYRLKAGGSIDKYNYEAMYEYFGRDYAVIGNQMVQKDKQGLMVRAGANLGNHSLSLNLSRYNDNVTGDPLFPRIVNVQGNADYSFNGIQNLPMGINLQTGDQDSRREPAGTNPIELHTNSITGRIGYIMASFNINFQSAYSKMDDRTPANNDTTSITYTLSPSYNIPNFSVTPNFSLNQAKNTATGVDTDTYTMNLDIRTKFLRDKGSFDTGGSYNIVKTDDKKTDTRNIAANFRLGYIIKDRFMGFLTPTVALRGAYIKTTDRITHSSDRDALSIFLSLSTAIPFSF